MLQDQETIPWSVARADLELWLQETMPVILIVYDSQVDIAYWLYVQAYFEALSDFQMEDVEVTVTVYLKRSEMVTENAVRAFAGYKENSCCAKLKEWFAMNRPLRFADLECLLVRLGFQRAETTGSQIVFEHSPSATVLVFPPYRNEELVRLQHRMKTKTLLDLRGLLERSAFDRMAEEIEETATCSS